MKDALYRIGSSDPRFDAHEKATGRTRYAADHYGPDLLWAGVRRAAIPHGHIKSMDVSRALALEGVAFILTASDIKGTNRVGVIMRDEPVLAERKIHRRGQPLALVIARGRSTVRKAVDLIDVEYDELPGVFDPEDALRDGAPLVHDDNERGNLVAEVIVNKGLGSDALHECDVVVETVFETQWQEHAYLETEAGWARIDEDGRLSIVASTQTPFRDRAEVAAALGLDPGRVRIIAPFLGGAFGGKDGISVQCLLGLAALHTSGRPVKMWWDREESLAAGVKRLPARMYYRLGATVDGRLHALHCRLFFDTGAYANLGGEVMTMGSEHAGSAYRIPHTRIEGYCAYTNNAAGGPFRGFGVPQVTAAMEQAIDMLASRLGMDALEIRRLNALRRGDRNCIGVTLEYSTGLADCIESLSRNPLWTERDTWKGQSPPFKVRGTGISCMSHAMGYPAVVPDYGNAKLELTPGGTIKVYAGISDMGQGNASTYLQIAGSILGQGPANMELVLPDTERTLPSGSSSASRCTYVFGNAVIEAAKALKHRIISAAAAHFGLASPEDILLAPGKVRHSASGREVGLGEIAVRLPPAERLATGYFKAPAATEGIDIIRLGPHLLFSYGAHLASVEIDTLTGAVEVKKYVAATDAGRVLNPQVYAQQIHGAVAQGIGYALMEDFLVRNGRGLTTDLSTYIIPTSLDLPDFVCLPVESEEATGPFGMKGVGEVVMSGPMAAISNAIADACGVRLSRGPFTAERVLEALAAQNPAGSPP